MLAASNLRGERIPMPRPTRIHDYDEYVIGLIQKDSVRQFLEECNIKTIKLPRIFKADTCGVNVAGQTWIYKNGDSDIELSSWILVDIKETKRVIRHEFAHILKSACKLPGTAHGKTFNKTLNIVSPIYWRKDRHWYSSEKIDEVRQLFHPRMKISGVDKPPH